MTIGGKSRVLLLINESLGLDAIVVKLKKNHFQALPFYKNVFDGNI